jgi:hypothetical protein
MGTEMASDRLEMGRITGMLERRNAGTAERSLERRISTAAEMIIVTVIGATAVGSLSGNRSKWYRNGKNRSKRQSKWQRQSKWPSIVTAID